MHKKIDDSLNQLSYEVVGAAIEVHRTIGAGLLEEIYEKALCIELTQRSIQHEKQPEINIEYKGEMIGTGRLDIWVERRLIIELKSVERLMPIHTAQLMTYLKLTQNRLGLLINFNVPILKDGIKRLVI